MLLALLPACLLMAGCESLTELQINSDDTYTIHTHFKQPRSDQDGTCANQVPALAEYGESANVKIDDQSTNEQFICDITISSQHISQAKEPFVTIRHHGETFQVKLKPLEDLDFLDQESENFSFSITFPGPVLGVSSKVAAKTEGNTVTWTDPTVLVRGFEVNGQDHAGMTLAHRLLAGLGCLLLAALIAFILARKNPRVAPVWAAIGSGWKKCSRYSLRILMRGLEYLDLAHSSKPEEDDGPGRHSSRGRRARQGRGPQTGVVPVQKEPGTPEASDASDSSDEVTSEHSPGVTNSSP